MNNRKKSLIQFNSVNYELLTISIELVVFYCGMR